MRTRISSNVFVVGLALGGVLGALAASLPGSPLLESLRSRFEGGLRPTERPEEGFYPQEGRTYLEGGVEYGDFTPEVVPEEKGRFAGVSGWRFWESPTGDARTGAFALEGRLYWEEGADFGDLAPGVEDPEAA